MLKYMNRLACWLLLFGGLTAPLFAQEPSDDGFAARMYRSASSAQMPYRLFVPIHYQAAKKYPLVLWLGFSAAPCS